MKFKSKDFKQALVDRALENPEITRKELAIEAGVGYSTLLAWIKRYKSDSGAGTEAEASTDSRKKARRPQDWSRNERFCAIMETSQLDEEAIGRYCREQGIYRQHLNLWKDELMKEPDKTKFQALRDECRTLKKTAKQLRKDLSRKEKALAEAAALLILKKKPTQSGGKARTKNKLRRTPSGN